MTSKHANDAIPTMGSKAWFDLIYRDDPKSKSKKKQESKGYVRAVEVVEEVHEVEVPVVEGVSALEERQDKEREALKAIENHADADSRQNPGKRRREESQFQNGEAMEQDTSRDPEPTPEPPEPPEDKGPKLEKAIYEEEIVDGFNFCSFETYPEVEVSAFSNHQSFGTDFKCS